MHATNGSVSKRTKGKKPDKLYCPFCMKYPEKTDLQRWRLDWLPGREWKQGLTVNGHKGSYFDDENILVLYWGDGCTI